MLSTTRPENDCSLTQLLMQVRLEALIASNRVLEMHKTGEDVSEIINALQRDGFRTRMLLGA
ncbi:MAG: hypothetical protein WCG01_02890 [bacterium]